MTYGTIRQLPGGIDSITFHKFGAKSFLRYGRPPSHREHFFTRPQIFFGESMAIQTPFHMKRFRFVGERHLIDSPVTRFASHSLVNVNAVIEVDKVWNVVYSNPQNRVVLSKARSNWFQGRTGRPDLFVAIHANFGRWNSGKGSALDGRVAVSTIDP